MQNETVMVHLVLQVVVSLRSLLQDRMAALNGRTVEYVLKQDKQAFIRLIGLSIAQVGPCLSVSPCQEPAGFEQQSRRFASLPAISVSASLSFLWQCSSLA